MKSQSVLRIIAVLAVVTLIASFGYHLLKKSQAASADINGDGTVNILDLSILASNWGLTGRTFSQGDINGDGTVNILDLSILASNWGGITPPAFMSYPLQTTKMSVSGGSNIEISNKSFRGITGSPALTITNASNVYIHDLDFDSNSGDIFLVNVTGSIRIENIRARNTGAGRTTNGSGNGEVIQLNNSWQGAPCVVPIHPTTPDNTCTAGIRNVKNYGGNTEDMISIYKSGGLDASHMLVIEHNAMESPLPSDPVNGALAWTSTSGTCYNNSDDDIQTNPPGGHDIIVRYNTALNCGQAGLMMNRPLRVHQYSNIVYGAQRTSSNVGITQWASASCSACIDNSYENNRVWWKTEAGGANPLSLSGTAQVTTSGNALQDITINPNDLKVVL